MIVFHQGQIWGVEVVIHEALYELFDQNESGVSQQAVVCVWNDEFSLNLRNKIGKVRFDGNS